jgi:hypothetical protein
LLLDYGNPFVRHPSACVVERASRERVTVELVWSETTGEELSKYVKNPFGQAGFGVRKVRDGYWVAIEQLSPEAQPVIDAVRQQRDALRAARYIVVDLRGNGGGNSAFSTALESALYGVSAEAINGADTDATKEDPCGTVYRASPGNIEGLTEAIEKYFRPQGDAAGEASYTDAIVQMKRALTLGRPLTGRASCARTKQTKQTKQQPGGAPKIKPLAGGQIFVLTDTACFSSCLIAVDNLRALGATQIGLPTAFDTHYSEVREVTLPSGLIMFSTLQAIMTGSPAQNGPFAPDPTFVFDGDIANTEALERWVTEQIAH